MKRLQVLINDSWEYVFCRNELKKLPIITSDRIKALKGDQSSLNYFQRFYSSLEFRIQ